MSETWTYYDANTIQIAGDSSAYYWPNMLLKITQSTEKFFVVLAVAVVGGNTRLTISGGGVYTLTNAAITVHAATKNAGEQGIPIGFLEQGLAYGAATKSTPADADGISLWDSAANFVQKGLTWANLKATLKTHFDPIYAAGDHAHSAYVAHSLATAANDFLVASGSGTFAKKTLAEVKTILGLGSAAYTSSGDYAPAAKGVTNGDSHDHDGGDGAAISFANLSSRPIYRDYGQSSSSYNARTAIYICYGSINVGGNSYVDITNLPFSGVNTYSAYALTSGIDGYGGWTTGNPENINGGTLRLHNQSDYTRKVDWMAIGT